MIILLRTTRVVRARNGFTLIEVLLSVALIGLVVIIGLPLLAGWQMTQDLDAATRSVADALYQAQLYARSGNNDSAWGVRVDPGVVVLFSGLSYGSRDVDQDRSVDIPSTILFSGTNEIVFSLFTGDPDVEGTVILTNANGSVRTVDVGPWGVVTY